MECKFIQHGLAPTYDGIMKPCCSFIPDNKWADKNHYSKINIATWHQSPQVLALQDQMNLGKWPQGCQYCKYVEDTGRFDSNRGNANYAYKDLTGTDITLEIRPGSVCNLACQTCWPEASSRVAQYHQNAGLINIKQLNNESIKDFSFLLPVSNRIKNVVLLGGEPFYDPDCLNFLKWAECNLTAKITIFTNGSNVNWDWISKYQHQITLVFSIDAIGSQAEYIRFGCKWDTVLSNFLQAKKYQHVELRVNVTTSFYNYYYIEDVIDLLVPDWPSVVLFGTPIQEHFRESAVPVAHRGEIISRLTKTCKKIYQANIESHQKQNALKAVNAIIKSLTNTQFVPDHFNYVKDFVTRMDTVKNINIKDYCLFVANVLSQ